MILKLCPWLGMDVHAVFTAGKYDHTVPARNGDPGACLQIEELPNHLLQ